MRSVMLQINEYAAADDDDDDDAAVAGVGLHVDRTTYLLSIIFNF